MTLLPRLFSWLFNVDMRYSVFVTLAIEDISSQQWDRVNFASTTQHGTTHTKQQNSYGGAWASQATVPFI